MKGQFVLCSLLSFSLYGLLIGSALGEGVQNPFGPQDPNAGATGGAATGGGMTGGSTGGTSGGAQNPFGGGSTTGGTAGGSGGTTGGSTSGSTASGSGQNPFDPKPDLSQPLLDKEGCPATRAVAPSPGASGVSYTNMPICPDGDGTLYRTADGATFFLQCCTHGAKTELKKFIARDFRECMTECSKTDDCSSVQFVAHAKSGVAEPEHECKLSKEGGFSPNTCGAKDMHSYAFLVDPPPIDSPERATILCSTECPYADGQQYTTSSQETFRLDCGRRHGTKVIYKDRKNSFKSCVEACGRLLPCHSVDYDIHRKICYYGQHQAEPEIGAPGFASAHSMGCAGACAGGGCCNAGNTREKEEPEPEDNTPFPQDGQLGVTGDPEPPNWCGNKGIQWAYYEPEPACASMDVSKWKRATPNYQSTTTSAGGLNSNPSGPISLYGSPPLKQTYFVIDHKGYLYASKAGTYTFTISEPDDTIYLWLGPTAYSGWTGNGQTNTGNYAAKAQFQGVNPNGVSVTRTLQQGEYLPMRIMFGQLGGVVKFGFSIKGPDGTVILSRDSTDSPYIVQYSCDETTAPRFPAWGSET